MNSNSTIIEEHNCFLLEKAHSCCRTGDRVASLFLDLFCCNYSCSPIRPQHFTLHDHTSFGVRLCTYCGWHVTILTSHPLKVMDIAQHVRTNPGTCIGLQPDLPFSCRLGYTQLGKGMFVLAKCDHFQGTLETTLK